MRVNLVHYDSDTVIAAYEWHDDEHDSDPFAPYADIDVDLWHRYQAAQKEWDEVQNILGNLPVKWEQDEEKA